MKPPIAKRVAFERELHGVSWTDHYHWLRAENWQQCIDDPDVLPDDIKQHLVAENDWFSRAMADTESLQNTLIAEMRSRIQDAEQSLPDVMDDWCYLERYAEGDEHPAYYRYPRLAPPDEHNLQLTLDVNTEAAPHEYFECGDIEYSPSHKHLAWSFDNKGAERYTVCIRDIASGKDEDTILDAYELTWGNAEYLFYTKLDKDQRPSTVYRHRLGTPIKEDVLVYEEHDNRFTCSIWTSLSSRYVFISVDTDDQSECWYIDTRAIEAKPQCIQVRQAKLEYSVEHVDEKFYLHTNADDAQDFKIMWVSVKQTARAHWQDWLPHREGVMVLDIYAYKDWLMWLERTDALPRICYCRLGDEVKTIRTVDFEQQAYALSLEPLLEFDSHAFRFSYQSPSVPEQTYCLDMHTGERVLLKQEVIPCGHEPDNYIVERLSADTQDAQQVPLTVLYHKNTAIDGAAKCLLSAYGAYGSSMPASFSSTQLSLVDRGFIVVTAHVRGGQEKGRAWYDAARGANKHNTFDDVVASAQCLISKRYTAEGSIVLSGGSAGGLMVAAVLNQSQNLWAGAIADVPFVDALNTLIDDTLPLTPGEWAQWGNPLNSLEEFETIRGYSPYDNVQPRAYPPMMVTAGVSDPRVTYWEPAKWVAQHRHTRSDAALLIFRTQLSTGHFGTSGRYASLADEAVQQAFALKVTGLIKPGLS